MNKVLPCLVFPWALMACHGADEPPTYDPAPIEALHYPSEHKIEGLGVIRVGDKLRHSKFGLGEVLSIEAGGPITTLEIKFATGEARSIGAELGSLSRPSSGSN